MANGRVVTAVCLTICVGLVLCEETGSMVESDKEKALGDALPVSRDTQTETVRHKQQDLSELDQSGEQKPSHLDQQLDKSDDHRIRVRTRGSHPLASSGKRSGNDRREALSKPERNKQSSQINDKYEEAGDHDYDDNSTTYYEYDDADYDESIYSMAHFRYELYEYVDNRTSKINASVLALIRSMQMKIAELETQLQENTAHTRKLESIILQGHTTGPYSQPAVGDLRLVQNDNTPTTASRQGFLQVFTGSIWGFICDDFFNDTTAGVACAELGYSGGKVSSALYSQDRAWLSGYHIVLDDVMCSGDDKTLYSCQHTKFGEHDCDMEEIVYLTC